MFRCDGGGDGGHMSKPGVKPIRVVTEIRLIVSDHFVGVSPDGRSCRVRALDCLRFETAKAILLCPDHRSEAPREPKIINPENPKRVEQTRIRASATR